MSGAVLWLWRMAWAAWFAAVLWGSLWPDNIVTAAGLSNDLLPMGLDKWLHVSCFIGLMFLTVEARIFGRFRRPFLASFIAVSVFAAFDELAQNFVPGRQVWIGDFIASMTGTVIGAAAWGVTHWLRTGSAGGGFVAHTRLVSALTLLSRCFGLVRDGVLARVFGISGVFDAFTIAFMTPNLFRRLFGEGALSAAFIPLYSKLDRDNPALARQFAAAVLWLMMLSLTALALLIAAALVLVGMTAELSERGELVVRLAAVTILYMPLICTAAVLGGLLQVHGRFGPTAASPIILNVVMIAAAALGYWLIFSPNELDQVAMLLAAGVVFTGVLQVGWSLWAMNAVGVGPRKMLIAGWQFRQTLAVPEVRSSLGRLWSQAWPTALGLAVFQLNTLADMLVAWFFSGIPGGSATMSLFGNEIAYPMEQGAVAALGRAQLLYEFPHGVFGIAVATAIFPALAKAADDRANPGAFTDLLRQGLRLTMFIGLPASIGLILLREPVCLAIFFPGDQLEADAYQRIAWILTGYAMGIWAYSTNMVLTRGFYAQHNTLTPMRLSVAMVTLNVALNLVLIWPLGAAGLAWSTAICAAIQCGILLVLVRRYTGQVVDRAVLRSWARTALITLIMAAAVWLLREQFDYRHMTRIPVIAVTLGCAAFGGMIVMGLALLMKMAEVRWLLRGK